MPQNIQRLTKAFDACKTNLSNQERLSLVKILINIHEALHLKDQELLKYLPQALVEFLGKLLLKDRYFLNSLAQA